MKVITENFVFETDGGGQIINITENVAKLLKKTNLKEGLVNIFVPGATGAVTTAEFESGLIEDTKKLFQSLVPERAKYLHDAGHLAGNAPSHLRASLVGPSMTAPFSESKLQLGTWQQIVFIDFDNRPRKRSLVLKFIGE